jgi:flavorubredoxin
VNQQSVAIPAHFLHSVGNFQFYDQSPNSFSGDMGASIVDDASQPIADFEAHIKKMKGCNAYVFQQGHPFMGEYGSPDGPRHDCAAAWHRICWKEMINQFLDWIEVWNVA